jgi:hypothetical protein
MPHTVLYHLLALNPSALDIRHQLIKILVEWQIKSKNTHVLGIGYWVLGIGHWALGIGHWQDLCNCRIYLLLVSSHMSGFRIKQADFARIAANSIALAAAKPQGMREFINLENVQGIDPAD